MERILAQRQEGQGAQDDNLPGLQSTRRANGICAEYTYDVLHALSMIKTVSRDTGVRL